MNSRNSRKKKIEILICYREALYVYFLWKELQNDSIRTKRGVAFQRNVELVELQAFEIPALL